MLRNAGAEVFEQYIQKAKPLVDILWHKCKMNRTITTPEEKALLEKDTLAEVAKIQNPQIRNYYAQEMNKRLADEFGFEFSLKKQFKPKAQNKTNNFVKKPPLDDMALRKLTANLILYPKLAENYARRLTEFEFGASDMAKILTEIINIYEEEGVQDSRVLQEKLRLNFANQLNDLWQIEMIRKQNPQIPEARKEIDACLLSIQLKQLDIEINKCSTLIKNQPENFDELYQKYETLKKERNRLLSLAEA
jgi:DNA primase